MIKITKYISAYEDNGKEVIDDIEAIIDEFKQRISIRRNELVELLITLNSAYISELKLFDDTGVKILLQHIEEVDKNDEYITFLYELLVIGTHIKEENTIANKVTVKFDLLSSEKIIIPENKVIKTKIENDIILEITNNTITLYKENLQEKEITEIVLKNIFEIISILHGSFPKVKYFEFFQNDNTIKVYGKQNGYLNTSEDNIIMNKKLIDLSDISNFNTVYDLYKNMKDEIRELPLQGFFISLSENQYYIKYKLCNLLQSLEGFCSKYYNDCIEKEELKKNKAITKILTNFLKKYQKRIECSDKFKEKICSSLGYAAKTINLREYLEYLLKNDISKIIFEDELKATEESKYILPIKSFIKISVDERNRLSHMDNKKNTKYFTKYQARMAYEKYKLLFRYIVAEKIAVGVNKNVISNHIQHYKNKMI